MNKREIDKARVLAALRRFPGGITTTDLEKPPTLDGLPPMERVSARIHDLKVEDGCVIPLGLRRGAHALYKLVGERGKPIVTGFRPVLACDGCARTRPLGSVCAEGQTLRPCLIDPAVTVPAGECDVAALEQRRTFYGQQEVRRAA